MSIAHTTLEKTRSLAYRIWQEQGCPEGRDADHWTEAERRLSTQAAASGDETGSEQDAAGEALQDTPGRAKSSSSRQQTQPDQSSQTGSSDQDRKNSQSATTGGNDLAQPNRANP